MGFGRQLKLGFIMEGPGNGYEDWRNPLAQPDAMIDFDWFLRHMREAERGKFDFVFYADVVYVNAKSPPYMINRLEPISLLSALASMTTHIGLAATVSSTYTEPFNVARMFASLDHISGGRAGWNLVTSTAADAGKNFREDKLPPHDVRYKMADEHLEVVKALWDSWEADALVFDKAKGIFFDPEKLHAINYKGSYYQVKGPMNLSRSPQGYPIIFQAGASEDGKAFAARRADAIFVGFENLAAAKVFYSDVKARAVGYGRNPDHLFVMPAIVPYVASTESEARALWKDRADRVDLGTGLTFLSKYYFNNYDFSRHDPDAPFPDILRQEHLEGLQASVLRFMAKVRDQKMTLRQAALHSVAPRDTFVGTPAQVADRMQEWFEGQGCDGYVINELSPEHLTVLVDHLVPELQRRGIMRREYEGTTFREHFGLPKPANRFTAARQSQIVA